MKGSQIETQSLRFDLPIAGVLGVVEPMAIENPRVATAIAGGFVLGVALQFLVRAPVRGVSAPLLAVLAARHPSYLHLPMQGCILWHNWWPMLTGREVCIARGLCFASRNGVGMRVV